MAQIARNIALAAEQRRRSARRRKGFGVLCAAAAALAIAWGGQRLFRHDAGSQAQATRPAAAAELRGAANVTVERNGARRGAEEAMALAPGDLVSAAAGARTSLVLAGGAEVALEPGSRVALGVAGAADALELRAGEIGVHVPKLVPPAVFSLRTPDARVVVHGTRFVVSVLDAPASPRTRVRVIEGRVGVEHRGETQALERGQSFPAPAPTSAVPSAGPAPSRTRTSAPDTAVARPSGEPSAVLATALAEQNRMFSAAVAASRRGDDRRAVALIDQLLQRHPASPLLPEARVERFRALKRLGRTSEAAREASRYLLENENGAAQEEARGVALP